MSEVVVIVAGGSAPYPSAARDAPRGATVIAADGGLEHAIALGLEVDLAIGDFDSASSETVARAEAKGTRIDRHRPEKDATDLELALDAGVAAGASEVVVLAGDQGRLDHLLSLLLIAGSPKYAALRIDAHVGPARVHVVREERTIEGVEGELVSLFALHGSASGVRTEGLEYALAGETLEAGSSRGVSNRFVSEAARISVDEGVLLVVCPGRADVAEVTSCHKAPDRRSAGGESPK